MTIDRGAPTRRHRGGTAVAYLRGTAAEPTADTDPGLRSDPELRLGLPYAAFCETHEPAWRALALTRIGSQSDAELVVTAVKADLARCWSQVLRFEEPAAYAWRLANRHVADWVASEEPVEVEAVTFAAVIGAFKQVAKGLLHSEADEVRLYAAILELPDRQRDVVILRYLLGLHVKVIAAYLGRPVATVHSNLRHARERLARRLGVGELPDGGGEL
ncbi:RNA polymerase sigma factor [Kitasatospora sp. MY 5-36]|uniref:RNA polymerase sigma factor n=1 Tax=Kitasatospora sp. MY 5-36 TaxID=1678027 RepID=UPI0009EC60B3|nr:sigma-70 family RNA polymerase sigma factor [Kitasatospora sp. MY 5-36]